MISLINVEINARVDKFEAAMVRSADIAESSLSAAAANADQFQTAFDWAADAADESSQKMASDFEAANDRIRGAADQSAEAIDGISKAAAKVDASSWPEKIATAIGAGFATGLVVAQTWMDKVEEFVKAKLILIGAALAVGITVAAASAIYAAYKIVSTALDFIGGLFTGESYRSENIDAVIALNKEVMSLQEGLLLSADHASALNEALKGAGVDSKSYVDTLQSATKAARSNTDELDRLGVTYQDANGELLSQHDILVNARKVLDEYTVGYDRNAAAAAIGLGNYKAVSDALAITGTKIEEAGQRLVDYNLIIGAGTQEAVAAYEVAMRAFNRELDLTAQGFKKAISDQIMPILTDLATFFKDGFPFVVNVFRYSMATVVSIFYGLKEVAYIVSEAVIQSFKAMGDVVSRVVGAIAKAATGDITGAWKDLQAVPDDLGKRWNAFGDNVVAQSTRNAKAMALAWGADSFNAGAAPDPERTGKPWVPKVTEAAARAGRTAALPAEPASPYQTFLDQLDQLIAKENDNVYTMLKVRAAQLAWNEGISATTALEKINALQIAESDKAVKDYSTRLAEENRRLIDARNSIGLYGIDLDVFILREQRRADVMARINHLEASGKPLTDAARDAMLQQADASAKAAEAILRQNDALSRTYEIGARRAFDTYMDQATNAALTAERQFTDAYRGIQQAMADFLFNPFDKGVKGMLASFGTMLQRMIADAVAADLGRRLFGAVGTPGSGGLLTGLLGAIGIGGKVGAQGYGLPDTGYGAPVYGGDIGADLPSFAVGTDFVPRDMVAQIHQGERIVPAAQNKGGSQAIHITVNVNGNQNAPDVRRSAGQGAHEAMAAMMGARRYA
ncbi:MAG: phage tail tape measure protein, lambda family [Candidatus Accumulibacter sp. BA-94]|nr:MAG: phage tail tape measure protein, lambda family [Candidatus Accumulibacter sp. BA-94]